MAPDRDTLHNLYVIQKWSYAEIAEQYGVTKTSVTRWLRAAGIPARSQSEATKLGRAKWVPSEIHLAKLSESLRIARAAIDDAARERWRAKMLGRTPPNKGKPWTPEQRSKIMLIRTSDEYRKMMAEKFRGDRSPLWNGGISDQADIYLHGWPWRKRRKEAYERDGHTCQDCRMAGGPVNAHHIIPRRHGGGDELENLVTLCPSCHQKRERRYADALFG